MSAYRPPPGVHGAALCPVCSYPHFPFCVRHPANLPSLPAGLDTRPMQARGLVHPPAQAPPQPPLLAPSPMALPDRSLLQRQSFHGQGASADVVSNGILSGARVGNMVHPFPNRGGPLIDSAPAPESMFRPPQFHNHASEPYQNPVPQSFSRSNLNSDHVAKSVAQFPHSSTSSATGASYIGPPYSGPRANDEDRRNFHSAENLPSMPQWFVDQQRRSGSKDATMTVRSGVGDMLRADEVGGGPHFGMAAPGSRRMNQGRVEGDSQGRLSNEERQESSGLGFWPRESVPLPNSRPFQRSDMSGSGITDSSLLGRVPHRSGNQVLDREQRMWDAPGGPGRDVTFDPGLNIRSGHPWKQANAQNAGDFGPPYQIERRDEGNARHFPGTSPSRGEQFIFEQGLADHGARGHGNFAVSAQSEHPEELWDGHRHGHESRHPSTIWHGGTAKPAPGPQRLGQVEAENLFATLSGDRLTVRADGQQMTSGAGNGTPADRFRTDTILMPEFENFGSRGDRNFERAAADTTSYGGMNDRHFRSPMQEVDVLHRPGSEFAQRNILQENGLHAMYRVSDAAAPMHSLPQPMSSKLPENGVSYSGRSSSGGSVELRSGAQNSSQAQADRGTHHSALQSNLAQHSLASSANLLQQGVDPQQLQYRDSYGRSVSAPLGPMLDRAFTPQGGIQQRTLGIPEARSQQHSDPLQSHSQQSFQSQIPSDGHGGQAGQSQIQIDQPAQVQHLQHQPVSHPARMAQVQPPLTPHSHVPPFPPTQSPLLQHPPQQGHVNSTQLPRFYSNTQEAREPVVGNKEGLVSGRNINPGTFQAAAVPGPTQEHHVLEVEGPLIPIHPGAVPPYPSASPPSLPPPQSPPMTPPPPPSPPPPTPPPPPTAVHASGLAFVPSIGAHPPPFARHPPVIDDIHRFQYAHMTQNVKPPPQVIPQPPALQQPMNPWYVHHQPFADFGSRDQMFPPQQDKPKVVDAVSIFRKPGRLSRPDRFVVILRGLPGSGKSHLVKGLRDVELINGGTAPRIHSIDDYFMTEVEKVDGDEFGTKPLSNGRKKERVVEKVMEYCFEAEMEQVYRGSMLKAFRKTLEEGMFSFIIVDDRNVLVADFAQFWAIAKRSGYEVYLLEAPYKDPEGCATRNVHKFTRDQVQDMARRWEVAPPMYLKLDVSSLFRGDDLNSQDITEVEMDADDMEREADEREEEFDDVAPKDFKLEHRRGRGVRSDMTAGNPGDRWDDSDGDGEEETTISAKRPRLSADSKPKSESSSSSSSSSSEQGPVNNALSGLMEAYGKREKSVWWADHQATRDDRRFSVGTTLEKITDLVIGPGPGYNKASNPMREDDKILTETEHVNNGRKLHDQYRAEQDTFKAVFSSLRDQSTEDLDDEDGSE